MVTEKRLIDANALVDAVEDIDWYHVNSKGKLVDGANPANNTPIYKALDIYNAIKNAPTVDAVEVVRCKDCKHSIWSEGNEMWKCVESAEYDEEIGEWFGFYEYHNGEFYCAYGERKVP